MPLFEGFSSICTGPLFVVVEYAPHGNLRQYLRQRRPIRDFESEHLEPPEKITMQDLLSFIYQISKGMQYLDSKKVFESSHALMYLSTLSVLLYSVSPLFLISSFFFCFLIFLFYSFPLFFLFFFILCFVLPSSPLFCLFRPVVSCFLLF